MLSNHFGSNWFVCTRAIVANVAGRRYLDEDWCFRQHFARTIDVYGGNVGNVDDTAQCHVIIARRTFHLSEKTNNVYIDDDVCFDQQLLDELGRGTSTSDGLSIANAVVDALLRRSARSIFATHYHKLNVNFDKTYRNNLNSFLIKGYLCK